MAVQEFVKSVQDRYRRQQRTVAPTGADVPGRSDVLFGRQSSLAKIDPMMSVNASITASGFIT